jgi:ADP-heptose:LPS heptosyltransferase
MNERFSDVHKIAVLRATALGDYVAATPALYALRETYPAAEIVYLGRPWHKTFLEERPAPVDRVVVIPVSYGVRVEPPAEPDEEELDHFFARMRAERFDLAIQLHGGGRNSNPFISRLGARHTAGSRTPDASELERWIPYLFYHNEIMRLLDVVRLVGAEPQRYEPRVDLTGEDFAALDRLVPGLESPFAVLHPGASDPRRRWPPEHFAQVGDALARAGLRVVVTGVGYERAVVESVVSTMTQPALPLCDVLPMGGLAALLSRAAVLVSNDTGPMHLANAIGTPNVGIFWCGNAFNWSHFDRRRHRPLISWTLRCPLCGVDMMLLDPPGETCAHDACFVADVNVGDVIEAAFDLLAYDARFGERPHARMRVT